jgi:tetratricopeptide (TPR) repeat protein
MYQRLLFTLSLLVSCLTLSAQTGHNDTLAVDTTSISNDQKLVLAEQSYKAAKYEVATGLYESVLSSHGPDFTVYYNLGNAYFRQNDIAKAILNYERALRLKPSDRDVRYNLEVCQTKTVDKIEPLGVFLVTRWYRSLENTLNSNGWALTGQLLFFLFMAALFAYFFSRYLWLKKTGFYVGLVSLILCILSLIYATNTYQDAVYPDIAIIMNPTVTVKGTPDQSGTDLFLLHEGTKVTVTNEIGSWNEIELQDGNVGWALASSMEII